jgi:hypothetical protein
MKMNRRNEKRMSGVDTLVKKYNLGSIDYNELVYLQTNLYYSPEKLQERAKILSLKYKKEENNDKIN